MSAAEAREHLEARRNELQHMYRFGLLGGADLLHELRLLLVVLGDTDGIVGADYSVAIG